MPIDIEKSTFYACCCKRICDGCDYANDEGDRCPFCRETLVDGDEENEKRVLERAKANDSAALKHMGLKCRDGGDYDGALEYLEKAAELGDAVANYQLGRM